MRLVTADRNLGGVSLEMARGVLLRPIEQGTAVEIVVERVRDAIGLGVLAPGERLPAETDLARMLDVGVMTLRAALAQLRDDGLLETRRGRTGGSFVRPASAPFLPPEAVDLEHGLAALDVRATVESGAAWLAAERSTPREVFRLEVMVDWIDGPARTDKRWILDAQLHVAIAEMSRNERLVEIVLEQKAAGARLFAPLDPEWSDPARWNGDHRRIVAAIGRRDGHAASEAMRDHILALRSYATSAIDLIAARGAP